MGQSKTITLAHGSGGKLTHDLITELFLDHFNNQHLSDLSDGALLKINSSEIVFSTDSHVVTPLFFPGGDIGSLSVTGTLNDIAVMGALPKYLSCGFIIEEGFEYSKLQKIVESIARVSQDSKVSVVTGDTKVVERGAADGLFINTSAIGEKLPRAPRGLSTVRTGDVVILTGSIGDHGISIFAHREGFQLQTDLQSDCAAVFPLVERAMNVCENIRIMRDPTRGGLATTLNEFVRKRDFGIEIDENKIPIKNSVVGACELFGFDPLYLANEGKVVLIVPEKDQSQVLDALKSHSLGRESCVIGRVTNRAPGKVFLQTSVGGDRIVDMLVGDILPRIC